MANVAPTCFPRQFRNNNTSQEQSRVDTLENFRGGGRSGRSGGSGGSIGGTGRSGGIGGTGRSGGSRFGDNIGRFNGGNHVRRIGGGGKYTGGYIVRPGKRTHGYIPNKHYHHKYKPYYDNGYYGSGTGGYGYWWPYYYYGMWPYYDDIYYDDIYYDDYDGYYDTIPVAEKSQSNVESETEKIEKFGGMPMNSILIYILILLIIIYVIKKF